MKKIIALLFIIETITVFNNSYAQEAKTQDYNAVIIQHFDKSVKQKNDQKITFMDNYGFLKEIEVPRLISDPNDNVRIIKMKITTPHVYNHNNMGTLFLISPGDTLDYYISFFYDSKNHYGYNYNSKGKFNPELDRVIGDTLNGKERRKFNFYDLKTRNLLNEQNYDKIDFALDRSNIVSVAKKSAGEFFITHSKYSYSKQTRQFIYDYYTSNLLYLIYGTIYELKNSPVKNHITCAFIRLIEGLDTNIQFKSHYYWHAIRSLHKTLKNCSCEPTFNIVKFKHNLSSETCQFLKVLDIEDSIRSGNNTKIQDTTTVTIKGLKEYVNSLKSKKNNLNMPDEVSSIQVRTYDDKIINFDKIFKNSSKKYLIFDMCGTWCEPCMENIQKYSVGKPLDTSKSIEPYWLFYENDTISWKKAIAKYHLKKENCYLMTSKDGLNILEKSYFWVGTFPHYFLFQKSGKLISGDAPDFSDVSGIMELIPFTSSAPPAPSSPPPPPNKM